MQTTGSGRIRHAVPLLAAALLATAACGDATPASLDTTPDTTSAAEPSTTAAPAATPTASGPEDGGFGAPAAAPGEFDQLSTVAMTGTAELARNGCWYLAGGGNAAPLIAPTGTTLGTDGNSLVGPDGTAIAAGSAIDATGALLAMWELPGGPDGRWGEHVARCEPRYDYLIVATSIAPAFDPAGVDPVALAAELDASLFETDHGCGYGFTTGDADGGWALRVDVLTPTPPAAGPVELPDGRFAVSVVSGAHLFVNHCDDVWEWFEPASTRAVEWPVTAGRFVYPEAPLEICSGAPPATITLEGAVVDTPAGPVALDPIEITNTAFGCFAG